MMARMVDFDTEPDGRLEEGPTRVIAVVLTEREWKEFLAVQPQPVNWLKERIRERVESAQNQSASTLAS